MTESVIKYKDQAVSSVLLTKETSNLDGNGSFAFKYGHLVVIHIAISTSNSIGVTNVVTNIDIDLPSIFDGVRVYINGVPFRIYRSSLGVCVNNVSTLLASTEYQGDFIVYTD